MAMPTKYGIEKKINSMEGLSSYENGGKGSGNFGHSGRPGEVGGSGTGSGGSYKVDDIDKRIAEAQKRLDDVDDLIAQEETFGDGAGDMSQLESLRQEAQDELDSLRKQKASQKKDQPKQKSMLEEEIDSLESELADLQYEIDKVEQEFEEGRRTKIDMLQTRASLREEMSQVDLEYHAKLRKLRESEENSLEGKTENGGKGSGNFGHGGRPGKVGGSGRGSYPRNLEEAKKKEKEAEKEFSDYVESHKGIDYDQKIADKLGARLDDAKEWRRDYEQKEVYKKMEEKGKKEPKTQTVSLKGKSLYEKVHMIEPGDTVYIKPQDNLPNFDKKIKVDYIQDGTIHYGATETSDGYTYPAWAIKDITKIERKNGLELNGGPGSGNFGHSGRPGQIGGSGKGSGINVHSGSDEMDYYYAEDGDRVLASGKTEKEALEKAKKKLAEEKKASWDEPYKEFTKTDQIGVGDYGEAGFFTTGNFAVDAHLDAKDVVDSVKDYNIINDMIFEAETRDRLASTPEGIRIEGLITDLKGELHAQNVYSSATFETSDIRRKILLQTAASVASIRDKLEDARGIDRYDKYIDKAVDIAKKTERRATTAANKSYDEWQTHKTAKPQVAGGSAKSDRPMTKAYDDYQIEKQRKRGADLAYAFSR